MRVVHYPVLVIDGLQLVEGERHVQLAATGRTESEKSNAAQAIHQLL